VVLPGGISGFDLAEKARAAIPGVRVLFMSGYAEPAVRRQGIIPAGAGLIQKPFRRADLAKMVQKVLQEEKP
jgi:two-component SAPR family response regulator